MANAAIDMWAPILPVPEVMAHLRDNFPDLMLGYLRVFWKQQPTQEAVRARVEAAAQPLDRVMAAIDAAGIGIVVDWVGGPDVEIHNTIINYGQIHTTADGSLGILVLGNDNVIKNYGTIQTSGYNSFGISMEAGGNHADVVRDEQYGQLEVAAQIEKLLLHQ